MQIKIQELYALEQLASNDTCIHRIHPTIKLLTTMMFIAVVVSFNKYSFAFLIPYILYPTLLMLLSKTPYSMLLKRFLVVLPFCLFIGISNMIFDTTYGYLSLLTILLRVYLCVMAVFVLVSVTPFSQITGAMRSIKIPHIFVVVFEMTYRYIGILLGEVYSMYIAYRLRNPKAKGIEMRDMGSFAGSLLIRSFDRAERVYNAMKCRGYALQRSLQTSKKLKCYDIIFFVAICFLCITLRFVWGSQCLKCGT